MADSRAGKPDEAHRVAWPEDNGDAVRPDAVEPGVSVPGADRARRDADVVSVADAIGGHGPTRAHTVARPRARRSAGLTDVGPASPPGGSRWFVALLAVLATVLVDPSAIWSPRAAGTPDDSPSADRQQEPAAPAATLIVRSTPDAARVIVDGQDQGVTPLEIADISAGRHHIVLEGAGGRVDRTVVVRDKQTTAVIEALIHGWIAVFSRVRLDIYRHGRLLGSTEDGHLMIESGRHELELVSDRLGFRAVHVLEVEPGAVTAYTVPLPTGLVRISGAAGTQVWVDGERLGVTPLAPASVPIGTRAFRLRFPDAREATAQVDVTVGDPATLMIDRATALRTGPATAALKAFPPGSGG